MRPLNRPMFRYGGPIKQGIMSGIREPKKNGGSMREKQGKYLVGDPIYPKTDGRAHHAIFGGVGVAAALAAAGRAGMRYIPQLYRAGKRIFGKTTPASITKGGSRVPGASGSYTPVTINPAKFTPNFLGKDPILRTIAGGGAIGSKLIKPAGKFMFGSPTGLVLTGLGGKQAYDMLKADPKKDTDGDGISDINKKKRAIGMPENLTLGGGQNIPDPRPEGPSAAEIAKARMNANKKKYYEIMGIDKMGKEAVGDSLINASRAINALNMEGVGLKEGLKSGKLQNLVIEGISKAMDKPGKTKQAVDAAILKAEITKDINEGKGGTYYQNAKDYAKMKYGEVTPDTMARAYKDLGFNKETSFAEDVITNAKNIGGGAVTSDVLKLTIQDSLGTVPTVLADTTKMAEIRKSDDFTDDRDFALKAVAQKPDGIYIIDTIAVAVQDGAPQIVFEG